MTETAITPLQRLAKVLQLGTPSMYRNHMYVNGESLYFPTGRVYGGQVIAPGYDGRIQNGVAVSPAEFDSWLFHFCR